MGGAFSCGQDNDDLVNILIVLGYIKSKSVERVFREVDRADYILPSHRDLAYKDLSWKVGNIHLSAPCVYCKVMEGLSLKPGLSFLNIGSGTGYLSTMAGLILGDNGTNHGIEMHEDCLAYAYEHLEVFKEKSQHIDDLEFCEPAFQLGNFLNVIPNRQYDRVYCGAACPEIHEQFVKLFVRVGGILVMPYKDQLLRIERIGESTWRHHSMLPVSFAMLATPQEGNERGLLNLPLCQPISLQELCRGSIRRHLRKIIWSEHNDLERKTVITPHSVVDLPRSQLHFGMPFLEELPPEAQQREVVTSTWELVRAVAQLSQTPRRNTEDELRDSDTSEDSEEVVDRLEVDLFDLFRAQNEPEGSTKEAETTETEMQEDYLPGSLSTIDEDDRMEATDSAKQDNSTSAKVINDPDMEADDSDQAESRFDRSFESKLKRRKSEVSASDNGTNESGDSKIHRLFDENDIPEEAQNSRTSASRSPIAGSSNTDDDDDEDDDLEFALIKKAFSILKDKLDTKMEGNSESDSSDSSCEESNSRNTDHRDTSVGAKKTSARNSETARNAGTTVDDNGSAESLFGCQSESQINEGGSYNCFRAKQENDTKNLASDRNCSDDDCKSPRNRISDSTVDMLSEDEGFEMELYQRCRSALVDNGSSGTSQKRRSDQRPESSGSKSSSNVQSPNSNSSNSSSDENDSEADLYSLPEKKVKRYFAHKIHKEALSGFMKKKIGLLPLPLPLRLYINYNREL